MLKVLKWEFIKRLQEFKIFYLILIGIAIVCLVIPTNMKNYDEIIAMLSSLYGSVFFVVHTFSLMIAITSDLRRPYAILEKSINKKPWEIISAKLINNTMWMLIIYGSVLILSWILQRFATENLRFMRLTISSEALIMIGLFLPIIILFVYLSAKSISFTKGRPAFTTIVFFVVISIIISIVVPDSSFNLETLHGNIILIILGILLSILSFIGSCILYERNYEL